MPGIRLLIADDHYVTRSGLVAMANESPTLTVAGVEYDADSTLRAAADLSPDAVLVNLRSLGAQGLRRLVSEIDCPNIIVLRSDDSSLHVLDAFGAKVSGYADLDAVQGDLASLVGIVTRGCSVCVFTERTLCHRTELEDPSTATHNTEQLASLTSRELHVLELIAAGLTNKEISKQLYVSETTVKKHVSRMMRKLGVEGRLAAALQFTHGGQRSSAEPDDPAGSPLVGKTWLELHAHAGG